ncbi:hypothetical protein GWI33_006770 [Rhynchophorus ferrugineus]|uniref:CCHC-type domain-containing protein n=1 Tax=Rhynchophorus ferrugineus TaxID=354439 RepID=A0A834IED0_RHYFE|nr:hypothetical protein GWI33_006770 [Rhynchophorus ferrugineus]
MLKRSSPNRYNRRSPRRYRPRSVSPLPRGRRLHLEDRSRKTNFNSWDEPNWRKRIRSRSRERLSRGRESNQSKLFEDDFRSRDYRKESRKFTDRAENKRSVENRDFYSKVEDSREKKFKRTSNEHSSWEFEGHFGDHSRNSGHIADADGHNDLILDPSSPSFNLYTQQDERQLEAPQPPSIEPYVRHLDRTTEESDERIKRLEKLVEKLVEGNAKPSNHEDAYNISSKDGIPELIPINTRFTTSMWLNQIHELCIKRGFDENTVIQYTQDRMTGIMKSWFKSVRNYDFTWPELKLLITKTFPDNVDFATTLKLLVSRNKISDETITQYYFSKLYLCEACKITGEDAVSCLIDGLTNPFMKQNIKTHNFLTPEALYSEYLSKFPENEIPVNLDQREVVTSYSTEDYTDPISTEHRSSNSKWKVSCPTCKKKGHTLLECRHAPICYKCNKKGHIKSKCPMTKINVLWLSSNQGNLQTISCKINAKAVVDKLKLKLLSGSDTVLTGFGGKKIESLGQVIINLKVNEVERKVLALVVSSENVKSYPIIIGQSFLNDDVGALICNGAVDIFNLPKEVVNSPLRKSAAAWICIQN